MHSSLQFKSVEANRYSSYDGDQGSDKFGGELPDNVCILYYHGNDWDEVPSRQQYLMKMMSRYCKIFYLDKGRDGAGKVNWHDVSGGITVIRGLIRIFEFFDRVGLGWAKTPAARWTLRSIRKRYRKIIFWTAENWLRPYRFIPYELLAFDSMDPCFSTDASEIAAFEERDQEVMKAAGIVFATADELVDQCRKSHGNVVLLNNACEPAEYSPELMKQAPKPDWWPVTEKPIGAYLGSLDWRVDADALKEACQQNPDVHFILAGNIVPGIESELPMVFDLPNVTVPGRISVEHGRYLLGNCTFGLIPFVPGKMNDAVNPVKLYAYSLLGKPVLGTDIRELRSRPEIVQVAPDSVAFGRMVPTIISRSRDMTKADLLRQFALDNDWAVRASTAWKSLQQVMLNSPQRGKR